MKYRLALFDPDPDVKRKVFVSDALPDSPYGREVARSAIETYNNELAAKDPDCRLVLGAFPVRRRKATA